MSVLSQRDWDFWHENGYVVIHNAVPQENLDAIVGTVWEFLDMDPRDPEDWYKYKPYTRGNPCSMIAASGMVEIYQHQALWNNRQYPRVHRAFSEIWGTEKLWVSLDRANMKPPSRPDKPDWQNEGMIHWDTDTSVPNVPFGVQGVLYLTDTSADQGGFQCVPGFHNLFEDWVETQPADRDPRRPNLDGLEVKSIPGKAGDLLIWHRLLAHGNGHNRSDRPRLAQYIAMSPAEGRSEAERQERVQAWRACRPTPRWPGDPRDWEHKTQKPAKLTALGEKLLGLTAWDCVSA